VYSSEAIAGLSMWTTLLQVNSQDLLSGHTDLNKLEIIDASHLSFWVYDFFSLKRNAKKVLCTIDQEGVQAAVVFHKKQYWLVVRGTNGEAIDWVRNLSFSTVYSPRNPSIKYHKGFFDAFKLLEAKVLGVMGSYGIERINCTGHSQGAAVASIFAAEHPMKVEKIITFGQPRTIKGDWSRLVPVPSLRFVNNNDIVCKVPTSLFGYKHMWNECYFDENMEFRANISLSERILDAWHGFVRDWGEKGLDAEKDHDMYNYVEVAKRCDTSLFQF
jgi:pimeloyl-ACP methyl ester carboxylesterase